MFDCYRIENSFDDLLNVFSEKSSAAFSSCLFSVNNDKLKSIDSFRKLIYNNGNQEEIYTKNERLIIDKISEINICSEFYLYEKHQPICCRIIAICLNDSSSIIYDALAAMKICNKALDGFNIYILVGADSIYIGCDIFDKKNKPSCILSYPINKHINWEALLYFFCEVIDDNGFLEYYYSLINAILSIDSCYITDEKAYNDSPFYQSDYDEVDDQKYNLSDENLFYKQDTRCEEYDLIVSFEEEVKGAMMELDFIKSNRVNSLELLFEAEKQLKNTEKDDGANSVEPDYNDKYSEDMHSLLSNPEELILALKAKVKGRNLYE